MRWLQMATQSLRIRLTFEDQSVLTQTQRSSGMNNSWFLIEPNQHSKISDVCNHLLHKFNLCSSCPNGILLFMEGFVLPPSESTRLLNDKDIICVKRKGLALAEAIEGENVCNLLDEGEVNRKDTPADNGMLLLANEEFDKETGGYKSEFEDEEEILEDEPSPKEKASKKRKASTKIQSSKKKKHRLVVMDGVEDEAVVGDVNINNDESIPMKQISKKIKQKKEKSGEIETNTEKVKSPSKVKRKKKHRSGVVSGDEDEIMTVKIDNDNNGDSIPKKMINKKIKPNEETNKPNAETSDKNIEDDVEGKPTSTAPDGAKKVPSRSARRKKAKRQWRRELAKISHNLDTNLKPEVIKAENKVATNDHLEEPLNQDKVPAEIVHKNMIKQEERNRIGNGDTKFVSCVVRPGHIRFEPLDEDKDVKHIEAPDVAFQWNGITSKKKGQKWGLETFSTSRRDESQKETEEPSTMFTADTPTPDLIDFDQLPLYTSPQEGDVIAYRVLELTSSWTPELSSFRVGEISHYGADNIVLMPVSEYPIVFDKMDEDGPDNSLYGEDGSLEIKFAALSDVRSVKQSNSDAIKAVSNGVNQTPQVDDDKVTARFKMSSSNDNKENVSKDPSPGLFSSLSVLKTNNIMVANKELTRDELKEALIAKKTELMEINEEMKKDSGKNKWSYRALRGSALGPTMALLRSTNDL